MLHGHYLMRRKFQKEIQEFDALATYQDKAIIFATLTPHIDFTIPLAFNNVVKQKICFFSELLETFSELVQMASTRVLILEHFKI